MHWISAILLPLLVLAPLRENVAADTPSIAVRVRSVPLDAAKWDADMAGRLRYRGGVHLTSPDKRFGGLSSLKVSADGYCGTAEVLEGSPRHRKFGCGWLELDETQEILQWDHGGRFSFIEA